MSNVELWYSVKDKLKELQKPFISVGVTLFDSLNHNYPYIKEDKIFFMDNDLEMDNISGDNFKKFLQNMNVFVKKLSQLLPKGMKPISKKARMNYEYLTNYKNTEKVTYYPVTIEFDDGQYLIGLARQYGDNAKKVTLNRDDKLKVVKWLLNGVDITKEVYQNVSGKIDKSLFNVELSALAKKIASIVEKNHTQWIKANPQASINTDEEIKQEIEKVKQEITELQKQRDELVKQIEVKKAQQQELETNQENDDKEDKIIQQIENDPVYKKIMKDSFNGVMYNVANKYDAKHLLELWDKLSPSYKERAGNIMKGAMNFLKDQEKEKTAQLKNNTTKKEKPQEPQIDIKSQAQELLQQIKEAGEDLDKIDPLAEKLEKMYDENPNELKDEYEELNNILNKIAGV